MRILAKRYPVKALGRVNVNLLRAVAGVVLATAVKVVDGLPGE